MRELSYVLITPARNEENFIEETLLSVVEQSLLPTKWVIVSDASTDKTDEIVKKYAAHYPWVQLIRNDGERGRSFSAKVACFNLGLSHLGDVEYDIIGNLDADISFEEDYFEFLLNKFERMPELGVAGTPFVEANYSTVADSFEGESHVAGGCQLFRRECFEQIGGYVPVKGGGIDWIAVTTARMRGWKTKSFKEKYFYHHRKLGTGESNKLAAFIGYGKKDYLLGGHPLWEIFRIAFTMSRKPYVVLGILLMFGYLLELLRHTERPVSRELMIFHRREQMQKLKLILWSMIRLKKVSKFKLF